MKTIFFVLFKIVLEVKSTRCLLPGNKCIAKISTSSTVNWARNLKRNSMFLLLAVGISSRSRSISFIRRRSSLMAFVVAHCLRKRLAKNAHVKKNSSHTKNICGRTKVKALQDNLLPECCAILNIYNSWLDLANAEQKSGSGNSLR